MLCLGTIGMDCVTSESCYDETILQRIFFISEAHQMSTR